MADGESGEKTYPPTEKRLRDARRKGQVLRSRDLTSAVIVTSGLLALLMFGHGIGSNVANLATSCLSSAGAMTEGSLPAEFQEETPPAETGNNNVPRLEDLGRASGATVLGTLVSVLIPIFAVAGLAVFAQVGPLWTLEPMSQGLSRLDPIRGFKRMVSAKGLVELLKCALKVMLGGGLGFLLIKGALADALVLPAMSTATFAAALLGLLGRVLLGFVLLHLALGAADYFYERFRFYNELKMSRYEIVREFKEQEGDPHVKNRRRQVQEETLRFGLVANTKTSAVVLVNPTHIAVALRYERGLDSAPFIAAKGEGDVAARIIAIARDSRIEVHRNVALARSLYRCELGSEIPEELYEAVAAVLSEVYRLVEG